MSFDPNLIDHLDGFDEIGRLVRVLAHGEPWCSTTQPKPEAPPVGVPSHRVVVAPRIEPNIVAPRPAPLAPVAAAAELEPLDRVSLGDLAGDFGP